MRNIILINIVLGVEDYDKLADINSDRFPDILGAN